MNQYIQRYLPILLRPLKKKVWILSDAEISCNGNWCSHHDIMHEVEVCGVGGGMASTTETLVPKK